MKTLPSTPWSRLAAAARRAPSGGAETETGDMPFGFSARVVARARFGAPSSYGVLLERLAPRALGLASACALAMVVWGSLPLSAEARTADGEMDYFDPIGEVLTLTQS